jgi:tape measure domain-containing protein
VALELKIGTDKAIQNLKNVEAGIARLQASLSKVSGSGFAATVNQINSFKGINPTAVSSINSMAQAISALGKGGSLTSIAKNLAALSGNEANAAAIGVQRLANALSQIHVPPGLGQMAQALNAIAASANVAATSVQRVAALRMPNMAAPINAGATALNNKAAAARSAHTAVSQFSGGIGSASGVLNGFGIALGGVGFAQFIKGAYEAGRSLDGFKQAMKVVYNDAGKTTVALKAVDKIADELGIGLNVARKGFSQIATSMETAGYTANDTHNVFKAFSTVFRVMNIEAQDMARGFRAVNQIFTKGQIMSEEMKQQLGEIFPAIAELAKALNMSPDGLIIAMKEGTLKSAEMLKMAEHLQEKYGAALPEAMKTLGYAVQRTMNGWQHFMAGIGEGLTTAAPALNRLADAMQSEAFVTFGKQVGAALGTAFAGLASILTKLAENISVVGPPLALLGASFAALGAVKIVTTILGWTAALVGFGGAATTASGIVAPAIGGIVRAFIMLNPYVRAAGIAIAVVAGLWTYFTTSSNTAAESANKAGGAIDGLGTSTGYTANSTKFLSDGMNNVGTSAGFLTGSLSAAWEWIKSVGVSLGLVSAEAVKTSENTTRIGDSFKVAADGTVDLDRNIGRMTTTLGNTGGAFTTLDGQIVRTDGTLDNQTTAVLPRADRSLSAHGGQVESVAGDYDRATAAVNRFISAASQASQLSAPGGGGGGNVSEETYIDYSTGGLTNTGSGHTSKGHSRWFHSGTAQYASGGPVNGPTMPGGGIPSILHSNEAVIPLQGGGIPVVGGGSDPFSPGILSVLHSINEEVPRIYEAIHAQTELMSTGLHSIATGIASLDARLVALHMVIGRSGGGSGGGGSGGGSGSSGSYYSGKTEQEWMDIFGADKWAKMGNNEKYTKMQSYAAKEGNGNHGDGGGLGSGIMKGHGYIDKDGKAWAMGFGPLFPTGYGGARLGTPNARDLMSKSFRTGTPNASRDTYGGFTATLHPDEAVIPLPDGRSVPVVFPQQLLDRMGMGDSSVSRRRQRGSSSEFDRSAAAREETAKPTQVIVNMTINAKDVGSFRNSKQQLMQELRSNLDQATKNIGMTPRSDDPTRRLGKNG